MQETEFEVNVEEHASDQDSYVCFGLYPLEDI